MSHSHLSAGNFVSSSSRDLFAELGVSNPSFSSVPSDDDGPGSDMAEADANPRAMVISLDDSTSAEPNSDFNLGRVSVSEAQELFKAVHYFSHKDREEAVAERKRVQTLMDFIAAHGLSVQDVDKFAQTGKIESNVGKVFDDCPLAVAGPSSVSPERPLLFEGQLVPVTCVGEDNGLERAPLMVPSFSGHPIMCSADASKAGSKVNVEFDASAEDVAPHPAAGGPKTWSAVVSKNRGKNNLALTYHPPSSAEGKILIKPPIEVLKKGNQLWASSLVGYFLHSKLPYKVVEPIARRLWGNR